MKKTYEAGTTQGYLMTGLIIRGVSRAIKFDDGYENPVLRKCRFTTTDKDIQDAIEATKQFKQGSLKCIETVGEVISDGILDTESSDLPKKIDLDENVVTAPVVEKPAVKKAPEKKVKKTEPKELKYKNIQQVANYLESYCGVDIKTLNTPEAIKKSASEHNLILPNIK